MSIRLESLDCAGLSGLRHLTYPAVWSVVANRFALTVRGIAARTTDTIVGLAVAVPGPAGQFELLSLYVLPIFRRMGFGAAMLGEIENEFRANGFQLGVHFFRVAERNQENARFFVASGWSRPVVNKLICRSTIQHAFGTPWLVEACLPQRYRVVEWCSLSADQRAAIPLVAGDGLNDDINPFLYEQGSDEATSVALIEAEDGVVRGWVITHRLEPGTLRWTCSFLEHRLQATALMRALWLEVARRQSTCPGLTDFIFTVPVTEPRMARFALRRMRPWLTELSYACTTMKRVARQ
jgi:GNAT superfamily N-acetyltransferase